MTAKEIYMSKRPVGPDDPFSYWEERMRDYFNVVCEMGPDEWWTHVFENKPIF